MRERLFTVTDFQRKKQRSEKITMLTAYDCVMAAMIEDCDIDSILVGDSLGMVFQGHDSTLPVTVDDVIYHCKAVRRGAKKTFIVADMPFKSYHLSVDNAVENACRFLQEAGANAVKLEGGEAVVEKVAAMVGVGIPVLGHVGLTPQSINRFGGYKVQGRGKEESTKILNDAEALQEAGCFAVVLECVPSSLAKKITSDLNIPTIGIGAGVCCDGQVLVSHDMMGYSTGDVPSFVKKYGDVKNVIERAVNTFKKEVFESKYPDQTHSFD